MLATFVSLESDAPSMTRYITGACTLTIALFRVWSVTRTMNRAFFIKHDKEYKKELSSRNVLRWRPIKGHRICHACT